MHVVTAMLTVKCNKVTCVLGGASLGIAVADMAASGKRHKSAKCTDV